MLKHKKKKKKTKNRSPTSWSAGQQLDIGLLLQKPLLSRMDLEWKAPGFGSVNSDLDNLSEIT